MSKVIPFVANITAASRERWINALTNAMPDYAITPFSDLNQADRNAAEIAIVANPDPAEIAKLPSLKWVQSLWAGVERLVHELPDGNLRIVRLIDPQMADTMAEAVLAWTLYLHRDMPRYRAQQEAGIWLEHPLPLPSDRTVGLLGLGALGRRCAKVLAEHGFTVCGWSRSPADLEGVSCFSGADGLTKMLARTNILVCLLPLTEKTRGLLNRKTLALLPKDASVINFARGPILDTEALTGLLDNGHLAHTVLDVFDEEPLPQSSTLWSHPSVTVLPHVSAPTNLTTASAIAAGNITRFFETGEIPAAVNRTRGY